MRPRRFRKWIFWAAPGCLLWLSCPTGTGQFLAPILQPVISQLLTEFASALTDELLGADEP